MTYHIHIYSLPILMMRAIFLCGIFASCTTTYLITLKDDGSANVTVDIESHSAVNELYSSRIISNIVVDTSVSKVDYTIVNIDSLGHYLPFVNSEYYNFVYKKNSLSIRTQDNVLSVDENRFCCHICMELIFEAKINNIINNNGTRMNIKDRSIVICNSRRQLALGKKRSDVTVVFAR